MSRLLVGLGIVVALSLAGCETTRETIRPPKPPEEYNPPPDDPRYSGAVQYPQEAMEQDPLLKKALKEATKTPPNPGGGPRMGAPGRPPGM